LRSRCAVIPTVTVEPSATDDEECAMKVPTLDESVDQLKAVAGLDDFDPDVPLPLSDADSLDLVEWLYAFQERHPDVTVDESVLEHVDDTVSFRDLHDRIIHAHFSPAAASAGGRA
jgi:hypothetical protein